VLDAQTAVLDHALASLLCGLCSFVVCDAELEPDRVYLLATDGLVDDARYLVGRPEHVDDVDIALHLREGVVSPSTEYLVGIGIDGDDPVPVFAHILRDGVCGLCLRGRTPDDGDRVQREDLSQRVVVIDWHTRRLTGAGDKRSDTFLPTGRIAGEFRNR
jgi:hypothetical protein